MAFTSSIPPSLTRKTPSKKGAFGYDHILRTQFTFETILTLGALLQCVLFLTLPSIYAVLPAALFLLVRIAQTVLISAGLIKNHYLEGVLPGKYAPQVPDRSGEIKKPGQENIAILLLGSKSNHPLGIFAPGYKQIGDYFEEMYKELEGDDAQENGFLGVSTWQQTDQNGAIHHLTVSYWRSIEDVHAYANGPTHRRAMQWWDKAAGGLGHAGIMHEVFEAPAGMYETIYVNFQPTLLGRTTYLKRGEKVEGGMVPDQWISPLIDASRGPLKFSRGRRGLMASQQE